MLPWCNILVVTLVVCFNIVACIPTEYTSNDDQREVPCLNRRWTGCGRGKTDGSQPGKKANLNDLLRGVLGNLVSKLRKSGLRSGDGKRTLYDEKPRLRAAQENDHFRKEEEESSEQELRMRGASETKNAEEKKTIYDTKDKMAIQQDDHTKEESEVNKEEDKGKLYRYLNLLHNLVDREIKKMDVKYSKIKELDDFSGGN